MKFGLGFGLVLGLGLKVLIWGEGFMSWELYKFFFKFFFFLYLSSSFFYI